MGFLRVFHVFVSNVFSKTRHHKLNLFLQFSFRMPCFPWFSMGFPWVSHGFSMVFHGFSMVYPMHFAPVSPTFNQWQRRVSRPLGGWHRARRPRSGGLGAAFALDGAKTCGAACWTNILPWKITIFNGKIHYKWPFSIAMLVHQRVLWGMVGKFSMDGDLTTRKMVISWWTMVNWMGWEWDIPSGKHIKSYWNCHLEWVFPLIDINSMVIFHSYVSLPEGNLICLIFKVAEVLVDKWYSKLETVLI